MIEAVLLDFGGVVFRNKEEYEGPKGQLQIDPELWYQARLGQIDDDVAFTSIGKNYGVDSATVLNWLLSKREPNQELLDLLVQLRPGIKTAVINNGLKSLFHGLLDKYNLKNRFNVLVNSAEEGVEKPNPEIFLRTCRKLEVAPEACLMADDDQKLLEGVENLGIKTILFSGVSDLRKMFEDLNLLV